MKIYSSNINLNIYELNILMELLEKEIDSNGSNENRKLYLKLEDYMSNIKFSKNDKSVEKILENQKVRYIEQ